MNRDKDSKGYGLNKDKAAPKLLPIIVPMICTVSLVCYIAFSQGLQYLLSSWDYYLYIYNSIFSKGFMEAFPLLIPATPCFPTLYNGSLTIGFLCTCLLSAWLIHSLIKGRHLELGPHLILFSMALAIIPTLLMSILFWPDGQGKLTMEMAFGMSLISSIILVGLKVLRSFQKIIFQKEPKYNDQEPLGWAVIFWPVVVIIFVLIYMRGSISMIGSDALAYHLPLAASWFHNGSITRGFDIQYLYPGNAELMFRWGFLFSSDYFVFLIPFITAILLLYMVYKLGRVIGQGRQVALIAACCAITVPMVPFLASIANTDMLGVLFILLSVFFLIRWVQSNMDENSHFFCMGLAIGLAAGTKLSMLTSVFAIIVVTTFLIVRSKHIWRATGPYVEDVKLNMPWLLSRAGLFIFAAFLGGGYWYLRSLIEYGNPFYPVAAFGLPGFDLNAIVPINPAFISCPWKRILYPWTELTYDNPFDHGIGAVTTAIVVPALILWLFLRHRVRKTRRIGPGIIYAIAWITLIMFAWSEIMGMRHGLFMLMLCFVLVGELWFMIPTIWLRLVTVAAFLIMTVTITQSLAGGYAYSCLFNQGTTRAERLYVPDVVDSLPPSRILNAAGAAHHTYGLMGRDYRHEVVTLYREARPEDVFSYEARYVLLAKDNESIFRAKLPLGLVGTTNKRKEPIFSLWKVEELP
ncbi:MAG: glycosyltransferase family 39 protein [Deltaproteobacteria bacterium]|nr:glycosyltransferase family 39 protein [Deltaproteobacteria bacterium]